MQRGAVSGVVQRFLAFLDAQSLTGCPSRHCLLRRQGFERACHLCDGGAQCRPSRTVPRPRRPRVRSDSAEDRAIVRGIGRSAHTDLLTVDSDRSARTQPKPRCGRRAMRRCTGACATRCRYRADRSSRARSGRDRTPPSCARSGSRGRDRYEPTRGTLKLRRMAVRVVRPFLEEDPVPWLILVADVWSAGRGGPDQRACRSCAQPGSSPGPAGALRHQPRSGQQYRALDRDLARRERFAGRACRFTMARLSASWRSTARH